jgi:hypothetical protein
MSADSTTHVVALQGGQNLLRTVSPVAKFPIYLLSSSANRDSDRFGGSALLEHVGPWSEVGAAVVQRIVDTAGGETQ